MSDPQYPAAPPPRPNNTPKIIAGCCGCASLGAIVAVVGIFMLFKSGSKVLTDSQKQADTFLTAVEQHDYPRAQQLMSSRAQGVTGIQKLTDIMKMLEGQHGKPTGHTKLPTFYMNNYNGVAQVQLAYTERFERGSVTVHMVMVGEHGDWKVQSFNFQL